MNEIITEFNGLTIKNVEVTDDEEVIIAFEEPHSPMIVKTSEWLSVDCDEFFEQRQKAIKENERRRFEAQEKRDAELRKQYPGLV